MKTMSVDSPDFLAAGAMPARLDALARRVVLARLGGLEQGRITLVENGARQVFGPETGECPLQAQITVHDARFFSDVAFGGTVGAAEAFIHDRWSCDDLTALVRILLLNRAVLEDVDSRTALIGRPLRRVFHWLNRNTRAGSRRNIAAHYDLGNDFYRLWLDERMMYSSAYFESPATGLEEAAVAKLDRICRKLELSPGDSVVEIGTGWGGFAVHAAKHYGCRVTTTTISRSQYEYARERVRAEGLEDRITVLDRDYRDLQGSYDKLVSIEMIEAVGHDFHESFFRKCCKLLKPHGQMLLQAITIADQRYETARKSVDFIKRYVFPGGCLTSVAAMAGTIASATDMRILHLEDIGPHYALTLRRWSDRFVARLEEVRSLGFSDEFIRLWQFYLSYCEGAFLERAIGTAQILVVRPAARREHVRYSADAL